MSQGDDKIKPNKHSETPEPQVEDATIHQPKDQVKPAPRVEVVEKNIDYKEMYLRALADYKNLSRQMDERERTMMEIATAGVIVELLPTLDMLEQASVFIKDEGLKMVITQFEQTLKNIGLTKIELVGKAFDPHLAEVVDTVSGDVPDMVSQVVKSGYKLGDRVIRVASVKVTK